MKVRRDMLEVPVKCAAIALLFCAALWGQPAPTDLRGTWRWTCCNGQFSGTLQIAAQNPDGTFSGRFGDTPADGKSPLSGRLTAAGIEFNRTILDPPNQNQLWKARLSATSGSLKMIDGNWSGYGFVAGSYGNFQAEKIAAAAPIGASNPAATQDLGATLVVIFPSVCTAIWTRTQPGVYDSVTVCQGPGNASFRETLTVQSYDGKTVIIGRPNYGQYRGTLSADHRTIRGTCDWAACTPNYRWTAYIDWNWNDSPPLR
jgi:hypothetical protein